MAIIMKHRYLFNLTQAAYDTTMLSIPGLEQNIILAPYTTYNIGGPAEYFVEAKSAEALKQAVIAARKADIPYFVLGSGANILVRDNGMKGLVIRNNARAFRWEDKNYLWAESGAIVAECIEVARDKGLSGIEHFVGIPSTVGGALWQNLHFLAPDRESTLYIGERLVHAHVLDENNDVLEVDRNFFQFGYDDTVLHHRHLIVLDATFQLDPASPDVIQKQMDANMAWRTAKQPQLDEFPSCGSVFKKIEGVGAGRLIDQAGLKGHQIGQAQISTKHANYIVNLGGATAADVLALITLAQTEVYRQTGYQLEPEITIIGEV